MRRRNMIRNLPLFIPVMTGGGCALCVTIPGNVTQGTTFTHPLRFRLTYTLTTLATSLTSMRFRIQDGSNAWSIRTTATGNFNLIEIVGGSGTQRAAATGVLSNGVVIRVEGDGATIRGYVNDVLQWTYASATNFQTETDGEVNSLGGDGAVADLVTVEL